MDGHEIRPIRCNRYGRSSAMAAIGLCTDLRYGRQFAMAAFDPCTDLRYGRFWKSLRTPDLKGGL